MAGKGSKNNAKNRGTGAELKKLDGKVVLPIKVSGLGKKSVIGAKFQDNNQIVLNGEGDPIPYNDIK